MALNRDDNAADSQWVTHAGHAQREGRRRAAEKPCAAFVALGLVFAWALVAPAISQASTVASPPPVFIASISAGPNVLSASGGTVNVVGDVQNATSCQIELLSRQSFPVVYSHNPKTCTSGSYAAHVTIGANPGDINRKVAFALLARNRSSSSTGRFYLTLGAPQAPGAPSVSVSPLTLPAQGGVATVRAKLKQASSCRLELLSKQSFAVEYAGNERPCLSTFSAHIVVGANPSPVYRSVALALVVRGQGSTSTEHFYVALAAPPPPTTTTSAVTPTTVPIETTTTLPAITTTTQPAGPTAPVLNSDGEISPNWSGYIDVGGPFTAIRGSFNVSQLSDGTPASDVMAEWVGIDGGTSASQDLIQAGIMESMLPCNGTAINTDGPYSPNTFYICPWTFFIANGSTSEGPVPGITVNAGDTLTIEIWRQSWGTWAISIADNTSGASWSQGSFDYAGPGGTAEWVVEAPTNGTTGNVETLAPYDQPVTFSGCGVTGTGALTAVTMQQEGAYVSSPGPYNGGAFSVSYGAGLSSSGLDGRMSSAARWLRTLGTPVLQSDH